MLVGISSDIKKYFKTYIDILDHNWIKYFEKNKIDIIKFPNSYKLSNSIIRRKNLKFDLIILSGGSDINKKLPNKLRVRSEMSLIKFAIKKKIPIIGICHGMQIINVFFKGKLSKIENHMRKNKTINLKKNIIFNKKTIRVKCFHNFGIKEKFLGKELLSLGTDSSNNIEMFKHNKLNIWGFMFHPEREKNFIKLNKIINSVLK